MLINISGRTDSAGVMFWEIPQINLDRRYNYKVGVRHLNFELLNHGQDISQNDLLCLHTNLIDLSIRNPLQSVLSFAHDGRQPISDINPTIVSFYPIQLYNLESLTFSIRKYFLDREVPVKHLYVLLEILRIDAYGRF